MKKLIFVLIITLLPISSFGQEIPKYERELFPHWSDLDHDGYNTRKEELNDSALVYNSHLRKYKLFLYYCPYTGQLFESGKELDIDHVVPLKWAWDHGAYKWTTDERELFANDPENLIPVKASANRNKGAQGPEDWLPPNLTYVSEYVTLFSYICDKYKLPYDKEKYDNLIKKYHSFQNGVSDQEINFVEKRK